MVYLEISAAEGIRRTGGSVVRPLLAGPDRAEKYHALMSQRVPLYREVATIKVNTDRRNPGAVVRMIVSRLENPEGNTGSASSRRRRPRRRPRSRRRSAGAAAATQTNTSGTETKERADND
ncbi:shikimate kinase [Mycobacteroides abscessus subsp. abscessus]|nr:shikimate kinase [Mycobacteroides abscessus subsp. abscessus]